MHVEMTACYFTTKMSCCRNVMFAEHRDTSEMIKISMKMTWGRIKKLKECQQRWHGISPKSLIYDDCSRTKQMLSCCSGTRESAKRCKASSSC
jgi:hypothetical protein